ncbi:hypothetical protein DFJ73DRAFT_316682 [Zopfochytrium polystomum]|nr:hypothetical protein DFJ73DRAFT_316682 [Zopfochytrium polystomum]
MPGAAPISPPRGLGDDPAAAAAEQPPPRKPKRRSGNATAAATAKSAFVYMASVFIITSSLVIAAALAIFQVTMPLLSAGRVFNRFHAPLRYAAAPEFATDDAACRRAFEAERVACEKIVTVEALGVAYMACDDYDGRREWYVPSGWLNESHKGSGGVWVVDLATEAITKLSVPIPLSTHGLSVHYDAAADAGTVHLFVVNHHSRNASSVEVLRHAVGSAAVTHVKTVDGGGLFRSINDVTAVSATSFYVTNDRHHKPGTVMALLEFVAVRPWGYVVFWDGEKDEAKVVAKNLVFPNGIGASSDGAFVFVAEHQTGYLHVFERRRNGNLAFKEKLYLGHIMDNIEVDPATGDIFVAGALYIAQLFQMGFTKKSDIPVAAVVSRVTANTGEDRFYGRTFKAEVVLQGNGTVLSGISTASMSRKHGKLLVGAFAGNGIHICEGQW